MVTGYATYKRQAAAISKDLHALRATRTAKDAPRRSAVEIAAELGLLLDDWQMRAVTAVEDNILLLVSRQGGKGVVGTVLALDTLINQPGSTVIVISKTERQAKRLHKRIRSAYKKLTGVSPILSESQALMELANGSEIMALPGDEDNVRGVESVDLAIIDEAAYVPESLYVTVRPMLVVSRGRCVALSTSKKKNNWFFREFSEGGDAWHREVVTAHAIPRIDPVWLAGERERMGERWFRQEYLCEFLEDDDAVFGYDDILAALAPIEPLFAGRIFG